MTTFLQSVGAAIFFWMAWIVIPFVMEIVPAIGGFVILVKKKMTTGNKTEEVEGRLPEITVIVPVYNSSDTLYNCLKSINDSTYPNELMDVMLVNNMRDRKSVV